MMWQRIRIPTLIYLVCLVTYLGVLGDRFVHLPKGYHDHFVYLADGILHGRLSLEGRPPHDNDWARVTEITLKNGDILRGTFLRVGANDRFHTTDGELIQIDNGQIARKRDTYYVSFPWFPAILMLPFVAIWGLAFNDAIFTAVLAAFNPVLVFFVLRRLVECKLSTRSVREDLWLVALFAFGTVHFFSSVLGQVWFTAHVVGTGLTALFLLAAIDGRHPLLAGICLACAFVTRPPILLSGLFFVYEVFRSAVKKDGSHKASSAESSQIAKGLPHTNVRSAIRRLPWPWIGRQFGWVALPVLLVAIVSLSLNTIRFDDPFEFGHYYLNIRWSERIQRWGLFNYHFVSRNLAAMLTLLPRLLPGPPYVRVSYHGLSLFFTTPPFLAVLWPKRVSSFRTGLFLAIAGPMIAHLLYQNTGWQQFGYRFSLDYTVYLIALLAVGGWPIGRLARVLIGWSIVVNTFGAITFLRFHQLYWDGMFPVP